MSQPEIIPPISPRTRRLGAREAILAIVTTAVVLVLVAGPSIRAAGEQMDDGPLRTVVLAVGKPAGWLGDQLPLADGVSNLTAWLSPDEDLADAGGGFQTAVQSTGGTVPPVTPDAFDPGQLGAAAPKRALRHLLVTGDSMTMPLDAVLARRLAGGNAVEVTREPHIGTGISKTALVDWGKLSARQTAAQKPDAVVVFIGANEGFPMKGRNCCDAAWAAEYANRARLMMNTYRRNGATRVYWLTLPAPRDPRRKPIARAVNAAIAVAAQPYRAQVRVLDMERIFTPEGRYADAIDVGGERRLVREADGIHLNEAGSELAADEVMRALGEDFEGVGAR
jgi:lysophospholipase L1-like esterase